MDIEVLPVKKLKLDLSNYRALPQESEEESLQVLVTLDPSYFWGLANSLLEYGCMPIELIVVLRTAKGALSVREGNRRIAVLKLALGYLKGTKIDVPDDTKTLLSGLTEEWKEENKEVNCAVFSAAEKQVVLDIVSRTHAKGDKASRLNWGSAPRARFARNERKEKVPELDLLEKFLNESPIVNPRQRDEWGSDYPLTVLEASMTRLAQRLGAGSPADLAAAYPTVNHRTQLDALLHDIGLKQYRFEHVRNKTSDKLHDKYGIPALTTAISSMGTGSSSGNGGTGSATGTAGNGAATGGGQAGGTTTVAGKGPGKKKATAAGDHKSVSQALRQFNPKGDGREKLVTLLKEARTLDITTHPHAFCFLLRSMFELSAKAFCKDNKSKGLSTTKKDGQEKFLVDVLREITNFLTTGPDGKPSKALKNLYHGPMTVLAESSGFLSVTSMNQLVHNPKFVVDDTHISNLFINVFPLLEAMNS